MARCRPSQQCTAEDQQQQSEICPAVRPASGVRSECQCDHSRSAVADGLQCLVNRGDRGVETQGDRGDRECRETGETGEFRGDRGGRRDRRDRDLPDLTTFTLFQNLQQPCITCWDSRKMFFFTSLFFISSFCH